MFCRACGQLNVDGAMDCDECGAPLIVIRNPISPLSSEVAVVGVDDKGFEKEVEDGDIENQTSNLF